MKKEDVVIYFSPATDTTGKSLAENLNIKGINSGRNGEILPPKEAKMVIGWGPKTSKNITFPDGTVVLNHPNNVRSNRNKLEALTKMREAGVSVAKFQAVEDPFSLSFPVIGRKKYHQGGKGFWSCPTKTHLNAAITSGAQYLQELIEIKDEYRLHVFGEKVLYGVKKVERTGEEFEKAFIEDEFTRQKKLWENNNKEAFNEAQALEMLRRQSKDATAGGPNMMIRSNKLGWKFSRIKSYDDAVVTEAIKAIKALGLDFGAVDCCTDADGNAFVIEVNTGPGLEGTTLACYIEAFNAAINAGKIENVAKKPNAKDPVADGKAKIEAMLMSRQVAILQKELEACEDPKALNALRTLGSVIFGGQ